MTTRRSFLGAILTAAVAPAFIRSGVLMPVRELILPPQDVWVPDDPGLGQWGTEGNLSGRRIQSVLDNSIHRWDSLSDLKLGDIITIAEPSGPYLNWHTKKPQRFVVTATGSDEVNLGLAPVTWPESGPSKTIAKTQRVAMQYGPKRGRWA